MANWDERFFVTKLKWDVGEADWTPQFSDNEGQRLLSLDSEVIKGAFYMETAWFMAGEWPMKKGEEGIIKAHTHDFNEVIAYVGSDTANQYELGGELEIWVDGKKNVIDRSFLCFVPAGIEHGPIFFTKPITKPIFHFTAGMGTKYVK